MKNKTYWSGIEYKYSTNQKDSSNLAGGFVYVFVRSVDAKNAMDKLLDEFTNRKLIPHEVEFISPYDDEMEWETPEQTKHYYELYSNALSSEEVIFDDFYAYEKE